MNVAPWGRNGLIALCKVSEGGCPGHLQWCLSFLGQIEDCWLNHVRLIASFGRYPDCRRHAGLKQKIRVGRGDDDRGGSALIWRRPNLRHIAGELPVRENV